jgi:N6-adenosine-specific RNA methylase IME4
MKYRTIVADPPWTPTLNANARSDPEKTKAQPWSFYETMELDAILELDIPTAQQAHLYIWGLTQHIDWAFATARAWGFTPVTMLTWCKPGPGVGRFRCNTEHVVVARKGNRLGNPFGSGGRMVQATGGTWFSWPRGEHSQKPEAFYDLVERLSPGPYLELFARRQRLGWDTWGNEALEHVEMGVA